MGNASSRRLRQRKGGNCEYDYDHDYDESYEAFTAEWPSPVSLRAPRADPIEQLAFVFDDYQEESTAYLNTPR